MTVMSASEAKSPDSARGLISDKLSIRVRAMTFLDSQNSL